MNRRGPRISPALWSLMLLAFMAIAFAACGGDAGGPATTGAGPAPSAQTAAAAAAPAAGPPAGSAAPSTPAVGGAETSPGALVPATLAGVPLSGWVGGEEARAQVEQLHGKTLGRGMDEAWVAQYGGGEVVLWVTRAVRHEDARDLYDRMVDRIAVGDSPFTAQQPMNVRGVEGYSLEGLGQEHHYFLVGSDLYWLAVDAGLAAAGLDEVVAQALTTAGVE